MAENPKAVSPLSSSSMTTTEEKLQALVAPADDGSSGANSPKSSKGKKKAAVAPTFDDVLYGQECPCTRREFREYLTTQRADEMIDFFETVETYTKSYAELSRRKGRKEKKAETSSQIDVEAQDQASGVFESARSFSGNDSVSGVCKIERDMDVYDYATVIVNQFVVAGSPQEINISYTLRDKFLTHFKTYDHINRPPIDLFEELQAEMRSMLRGAFPRFLQYVSTQNISEAHVFHRAMYGCIYFVVMVGILCAMVFTGIHPLWRLTIVTFWQGPIIMWLSAYLRLCDGLSRVGVRMTKDEWDVFFTIFRKREAPENKLTNEWARQQLMKRSTKLEIFSATLGVCIGIATLFIPPGVQSL